MMESAELKRLVRTTPAFIVDEAEILAALNVVSALCKSSGCKLLYSIKSLPLMPVLTLIKPFVNGFSVSSLFEAKLADEILEGQGGIHLTTPGIRPDELDELVALCSHISCNSINQYRQIAPLATPGLGLGLRINPKLSFTEDGRHDPCRPNSKLGIGLNTLTVGGIPRHIKGLQFHTVFAKTDYQALADTITLLQDDLGESLQQLEWLNLGGGYLFTAMDDHSIFISMVSQLINNYGVDVFIEPGNAIVGEAGYLLATVIDCFDSDGKTVAVLDTSVNHLPRVFEYQHQPELVEHEPNGGYTAVLAGSTCLAGDLFGEYRFSKPLTVGDKVLFKHIGAYSLVKANRFNGYNLPEIYLLNANQIRCIKQYGYQEYRQLWAVD